MTPTRRRVDGETLAHWTNTVTYPGGEVWSTLCGRHFLKGTMRSAEGAALCPACGAAYSASYDTHQKRSREDQP